LQPSAVRPVMGRTLWTRDIKPENASCRQRRWLGEFDWALADANERRVRKLYAKENLGLDVNMARNVYALNSITFDL